MNNHVEIVVYGSLNMDFVAFVSKLPRKGETLSANEFMMVPGGKAANQAVAASRLGIKVGMVGKVGNDYLGEELISNINQEGVLTTNVQKDRASSTGVAMIGVAPNGDNMIITSKGANKSLTINDINESKEMLRESRAVVLQLEMDKSVAEYIIRKAKQHHKYIVLNLAPIVPIDPKVLSMVNLLIVNETEATELTGIAVETIDSTIEAAKELNRRGIESVVVTLGANGALLSTVDSVQHFQPPQVNVVDSTAAGDCFVAAVTAFWVKNGDLKEAVEHAVKISALSVTKKGAQSSLPTIQEYEKFLQGR
ncbi:ribokinase [Lederbergia sp. NSJ-179]|uniref:ribokinase n=1 Tax=Lederbergia sp. NSJ-179 TaxID=2931402 RepID=UPI001FD44EDA|nr:ribokinase [Lederbergia sp. NSJ-179]MCJ7842969.1 ribokinase [Lederbergia sp. NSJ-179]